MADDPATDSSETTPEEASGGGGGAAAADDDNNKSALQDNIERKGKNAYYFAHAHKASGPKWDGKTEPKLLSKQESCHESKKHAFDYTTSTISKYAFLDDDGCVKLYIDLEGVGERCSDDDIVLNYTSTSMSLVVNNYNPEDENEPLCLSFGKLTAAIDNATCKKKRDRLIVTLTKSQPGQWHTINDKGEPDHQVV